MVIEKKSRMKLIIAIIIAINDKEHITGKKLIMPACYLSYRLKRSGPKLPDFYSFNTINRYVNFNLN